MIAVPVLPLRIFNALICVFVFAFFVGATISSGRHVKRMRQMDESHQRLMQQLMNIGYDPLVRPLHEQPPPLNFEEIINYYNGPTQVEVLDVRREDLPDEEF